MRPNIARRTHLLRPCLGAVAALTAAVGLAGCGDDQGVATIPGQGVFVSSATTAAVTSLDGGFAPPVPAGSVCDPGKWTYILELQGGTLAFSRCHRQGTGILAGDYVPVSGTRTLTSAELKSVRTALGAVRVSGRNTCGADKPTLELRVDSPHASITYGDDFYSCNKQYAHYVISEDLNNFASVLIPLGQ